MSADEQDPYTLAARLSQLREERPELDLTQASLAVELPEFHERRVGDRRRGDRRRVEPERRVVSLPLRTILSGLAGAGAVVFWVGFNWHDVSELRGDVEHLKSELRIVQDELRDARNRRSTQPW